MSYPVYVAQKEDVLAYPHYSDPRWDTDQLIYGRKCVCDEVQYDDRLYQWDWVAAELAGKAVSGMNRTAARWERWLSVYHGREVVLKYILAGVNKGNGHPYYILGYDYVEKE